MFVRIVAAIIPALLMLCASCVPTPTAPAGETKALRTGGIFVLCEGLWRQDNAVLSYINADNSVVRDVVGTYNPNTKLGDIATDIISMSDTLVIAVNTSRSLCLVRKTDGKWLGRISTPGIKQPFHLALASNGKLYCTNINDDSITEFDAATMEITVPSVKVGPAPEGIAVLDNKIYVANSGYGDLRKNEEGAGTIQILRQQDLSTLSVIGDLPNVGVIRSDRVRKFVWATFRHFASAPDSLGGVALIDGKTDIVMNIWRIKSPLDVTIDSLSGNVYVLHADGVDVLDARTFEMTRIISHQSGAGSDVWYSIGFDHERRLILVGNARSYVTDGEVIVFDPSGAITSRHPVGPNPIAFTR
ncbi:MAG: hypothetical protein HYX66_06785 [Ignavibacteria bacterium]|nr:hypothetical protein [Ignavibacteria bacterium]